MDIEFKKEYIPLILILLIGIIYIYLAANTTMLGEDEPFFVDLGKSFSQLVYPKFDALGSTIKIQPFVPLVFAIPFMIFGSSLALAKIITAIFGLLTLLVVYLIGKRVGLYYGVAAAFLLLSITLFSNLMMIVYLEVPIAFFSALSTYMVLEMDSYKKAVATGAIVAMSFLAKQTGLFLVAGFLLYGLILYFKDKDKKFLKMILIVVVIATVLSAPFILRNIVLYNYPYVLFLNSLPIFKVPSVDAQPIPGLSPQTLSIPMFTIQSYISNTSYLLIVLLILGLVLFFSELKNKELNKDVLLFTILTFMFLLLYYIYYFFQLGIAEPRNIFIIFPQMALIGGFFVHRVQKYKRIILPLVVVVVALSLYSGLTVAISTSTSQRYPSDYIDALKWLNQNTQKNDVIFTTYAGSVKYFADRNDIWTYGGLPLDKIMSTTNSTYIYEKLTSFNVSYILVWRGVLAQNFIIPQSNLFGVFTYNFLSTVMNDTKDFNVTYQNQDNIIFKLVK